MSLPLGRKASVVTNQGLNNADTGHLLKSCKALLGDQNNCLLAPSSLSPCVVQKGDVMRPRDAVILYPLPHLPQCMPLPLAC